MLLPEWNTIQTNCADLPSYASWNVCGLNFTITTGFHVEQDNPSLVDR